MGNLYSGESQENRLTHPFSVRTLDESLCKHWGLSPVLTSETVLISS